MEKLVCENLEELFENKSKISEDDIEETVGKHFDDAEDAASRAERKAKKDKKSFKGSDWEKAFNDYIRNKCPKLKEDKRNFYKIFNKYSPQ